MPPTKNCLVSACSLSHHEYKAKTEHACGETGHSCGSILLEFLWLLIVPISYGTSSHTEIEPEGAIAGASLAGDPIIPSRVCLSICML